ncbi:hypothetical protein M0802_016753 [Mischocyttarus mexicanus]|nr:hypothetical protein M0802_016753 [Mischocyttarus mexicanus]
MGGRTLTQLGSLNTKFRKISSTIGKQGEISDRRIDKEEIDDRRINKEKINDRIINREEINDRRVNKEEISDRRKNVEEVIIVEEVINVEDIINVENIEEVKNVEDIVSVEEVINVEDVIDVEEINNRRININKEVNIEEIDSREINKEVKLRKEKLNGKEINQNNFERKVGELGDGQATSDVDSHTRRPALEGKILEIIKCKEFMAAKPNEATSDVDKSEKIGEKSFNEERNETNQVLRNACETVEETEVEVGEIDDETTYSDFYKLLLEIKIDKEFDIQHNPQELDNLFHENNSEAGVKMHNQNFYSEVALKSHIISKDRLIEYNSGIKYKLGRATVNADTSFDYSITLCKPMAPWNTLKKIFKNTRKRTRCYYLSRRTAKRNRIFRINIQTPKVLKSFNHPHRLQYCPRYLYPPARIPLVHANLTLAQY